MYKIVQNVLNLIYQNGMILTINRPTRVTYHMVIWLQTVL